MSIQISHASKIPYEKKSFAMRHQPPPLPVPEKKPSVPKFKKPKKKKASKSPKKAPKTETNAQTLDTIPENSMS